MFFVFKDRTMPTLKILAIVLASVNALIQFKKENKRSAFLWLIVAILGCSTLYIKMTMPEMATP